MIPTTPPPEMRVLKQKVMMRAFALTFVFLMSIMVVLQLSGYKIDVSRPVPMLLGWCGAFATLKLVTDRDILLPFLGECVVPPSVLSVSEPRTASFSLDIKVDPAASHVVYWASESAAGTVPTPWDAYGNYGNAGVAQVSRGTATLAVKCPGRYKVRGKTLPRHVHYRAVYPSGIFGVVQTVNVNCL